MKKVVYHRYGPPEVLKVAEVKMPEPVAGQVLVKVVAAGINPVDYKIRNGSLKLVMPGRFPRTPGGEIAGIVYKSGSSSLFKPGDRVYAMLERPRGGYAQYVAVKEKLLCFIPANLSFEEAAALPLAGLTALQSLRDKGKITQGMRVLINGASGGVGSFAVQIAKAFQTHATGVCSGKNINFVRDLGADAVINYETEDFTKTGNHYDIILDAVAKKDFMSCYNILKPGGAYISTLPNLGLLLRQTLNPLFSRKAFAIIARSKAEDLTFLGRLTEEGKLKVNLERAYSLDEAVRSHQRMESERVRGKLVLKAFPGQSEEEIVQTEGGVP